MDLEALLTHQNPSYVSHIDDWWPLKQWLDVLMTPHTRMLSEVAPPLTVKSGGIQGGSGLNGHDMC